MPRSRRFVRLAVFALAAGVACAGTRSIPLAATDRAAIAAAPVVHAVVRTPDRFSVRTPGGAFAGGGGMLGGLGSLELFREKGEAMRTRYGIPDPALRVVAQLGVALGEDVGAPPLGVVREPITSDDPQAIAARFGRGLVLEARTEYWELLYQPTDWTHYRLAYRSSARLLEAPSGRVLWREECVIESDDTDPRPTLDALEANGAALLKTILERAADACVARLRAGFAQPT
jgi:hypothetical protein